MSLEESPFVIEQYSMSPAIPVARIFRIGYVELKKLSQSSHAALSHSDESTGEIEYTNSHHIGTDNVKRALRRAINTETTRMTQMVPFLATTGNTTPFIGLFGTVWGSMNSFHGIGLRGSANLAVVAPGISEALIATAAGRFGIETQLYRRLDCHLGGMQRGSEIVFIFDPKLAGGKTRRLPYLPVSRTEWDRLVRI